VYKPFGSVNAFPTVITGIFTDGAWNFSGGSKSIIFDSKYFGKVFDNIFGYRILKYGTNKSKSKFINRGNYTK